MKLTLKSKKNLLGLVLVIVVVAGCVTSKSVRIPADSKEYFLEFYNISDAHVIATTEPNSWRLAKDSVAILKDTIGQCNKTKPDLVLLSGDIMEGKFSGMKNLQLSYDLLSAIESPWFVVAGNHDMKYTKKDFTTDEFDKNEFFKKFDGHGPHEKMGYWSHQVPQQKIVIIGLNTPIDGSSYGEIDDEQLSWLDQTLAQISDDQLVILMMHHPIVLFNSVILEPANKELEHFITKNHDKVREVIEKYKKKVKIVISGHTHTPEYLKVNEIHYISTPSINTWPNRFTKFSLHNRSLKWEHLEISNRDIINEAWKNLILPNSPHMKILKTEKKIRAYFTHGPMEGMISF